MPKKDKMYMPSGMGGLIRYGEEGKQKIKLKPMYLVYIVVILAALELVLRALFVSA